MKKQVPKPERPFFDDLRRNWQNEPLAGLLYRHIHAWWWKLPPDPWDDEVEEAIQHAEALVACPYCAAVYELVPDFCPECGRAIGPYVNLKPFERVFSIGEVFRNGIGPQPNLKPLTFVGFILLAPICYYIFFPLFLFRYVQNSLKIHRQDQPILEE